MRALNSVFLLIVWLSAPILPAQVAQYFEHCPPFELRDFRGKSYSLTDVDRPYKVLAFLGTECPLAKLYANRLNELAANFTQQVVVWGINANQQDSISDMASFVTKHELKFPLLKDVGAVVADRLTAERTPEVLLLDEQNRVRYRGRIDDQYGVGYARKAPTRRDLRIAIQELIEHDHVSVPATEAVGCVIGRPNKKEPTGDVTYFRDVTQILRRHCVECHQQGQIAPFALTDYDEVVGWSETIREVIVEGRMPPWHANPDHGTFANARSLTEQEQAVLFSWIDNGMPPGEKADEPQIPKTVLGWSLPSVPDLEIAMASSPFEVPADGTVEYQYFVADPKFDEDKWVVAAEVVPGNHAVVHHAIVFVRPPDGERQQGIGWLTAFVPGQRWFELPTGTARRIPKGSKLVFQVHYTPIGSVAHDTTKVGLVFAEEDTIHTEVQTRIIVNRDFEIPAGAEKFQVHMASNGFPPHSELMAISPHMHYRGKSFQVTALKENAIEILLDVPNYDFNWQHTYILSERVPLDDTTIQCVATFDNSPQNRVNPDPTANVRWGDQTWEEMAMAYLAIAVPRNVVHQQNARSANQRIVTERRQSQQSAEETEREAERVARQFFAKLDRNEDGEILRAEASASFRAFAWKVFDRNQDDKLSWEEVHYQARLSLRP